MIYFLICHDSGKTVNFRLVDGSGEIFDFDDDSWKLPSHVTTEKLASSENTDFGDGNNSLYIASYSGDSLHSESSVKAVVVEALVGSSVVGTGELRIISGEDLNSLQGRS